MKYLYGQLIVYEMFNCNDKVIIVMVHFQGCHLSDFRPETSGFEANVRAPVLLENLRVVEKK